MRINDYLVTGKDLKDSVTDGLMVRVSGSSDIPDNVCVTKAVGSAFVQLQPFTNTTPNKMPVWQEFIPIPFLPINSIKPGTIFEDPFAPEGYAVYVDLRLATAFANDQTFSVKILGISLKRVSDGILVPITPTYTVNATAGQVLVGYYDIYRGPSIYNGITSTGVFSDTTPRVIGGYKMRNSNYD